MKISAGIFFWKKEENILKVLLVHPSGNYNKNSKWSIPKGEVEKDEELINTAIREVKEELGIDVVEDQLKYIGASTYKNKRKTVSCFISEAKFTHEQLKLDWEIDQAEFFTLEKAKQILHPDQVVFLSSFE